MDRIRFVTYADDLYVDLFAGRRREMEWFSDEFTEEAFVRVMEKIQEEYKNEFDEVTINISCDSVGEQHGRLEYDLFLSNSIEFNIEKFKQLFKARVLLNILLDNVNTFGHTIYINNMNSFYYWWDLSAEKCVFIQLDTEEFNKLIIWDGNGSKKVYFNQIKQELIDFIDGGAKW